MCAAQSETAEDDGDEGEGKRRNNSLVRGSPSVVGFMRVRGKEIVVRESVRERPRKSVCAHVLVRDKLGQGFLIFTGSIAMQNIPFHLSFLFLHIYFALVC